MCAADVSEALYFVIVVDLISWPKLIAMYAHNQTINLFRKYIFYVIQQNNI